MLADQVGLGKTIQLALAAQLMALVGGKPALILAPKPLVRQWQREMADLLDMPSAVWSGGGSFQRLSAPDRARVRRAFPRFLEHANPFIRHIVLRTRAYLEQTPDPETGEPLLRPVKVRLHGEDDADALRLPPFLEDAYRLAEAFCLLLAERANAGFFRTCNASARSSTWTCPGTRPVWSSVRAASSASASAATPWTSATCAMRARWRIVSMPSCRIAWNRSRPCSASCRTCWRRSGSTSPWAS